ncbi:embryonic polarity protein dorsal-like [Tubulanus polymorphus]|uniref:embryonic polarity protein dorsal-like n=1 Tax=Tubulanus polymorphus TaxID=672921 RepID=UPI003DA24F09
MVHGDIMNRHNKIRVVDNGMANQDPWVQIIEQPKARGLRYRYECEGRCAGSIPGEHSTIDKKSFPTIQVHNYSGPAVVVVSLVTKDNPPRPHPHSLVGKECKKGVCTMKFNNKDMRIPFPNLGIQCAKKKDIPEALKLRKQIRVDPFNAGFDIKANQVDLQTVRLCFQVFLPNQNTGQFSRILNPVVSTSIYDKKAAGDLTICRVDKVAGSVRGNDEIFIFCEKVAKDDIKIRFFEDESDWEALGVFAQTDVHKSFAIAFRTPPYKDPHIKCGKNVYFQLLRPSDQETSTPMSFTYKPDECDPEYILEKRKRKKVSMEMFGMSAENPPPIPSSSAMTNSTPCTEDVKERVKLMATRRSQNRSAAAAAGTAQSPISVNYDESTKTTTVDVVPSLQNEDGSISFDFNFDGSYTELLQSNNIGVKGPPTSGSGIELGTDSFPIESSDINITSGDLSRLLGIVAAQSEANVPAAQVAAQETVETTLMEGDNVMDFLASEDNKK